MTPTITQNNGREILGFMSKHQLESGVFTGGQLQEALSIEQEEMVKALMFLVGLNFVNVVGAQFADGNVYLRNYYTLNSLGAIALDTFQGGGDPFTPVSVVSHTGDIFNTQIGNVTNSAIAIGRHASATYSSGIDADAFNKKMDEFKRALKSLPTAEQEDGEYQLEKLARAAEVGQEAIKGRVDSFYNFLERVWRRASNVATAIFLYHISAVLFSLGGVELPKLPEGL